MSTMLRVLAALIALLCAALLVIPLLIVAIAAGPVIVMLLFITGCGGYALVLGGILSGLAMALRPLVKAFTGRTHDGESSTPTVNAAD
jgi:hypothetical protein